MHLYAITRGIKQCVDRFVNDLLAQGLPYPVPNPNQPGQMMNAMVQLAMRPIQLWEVAFPEGQLPVVLNTMCPDLDKRPLNFWQTRLVNQLRRILGAKKIPPDPIPKNTPKMWVRDQFVETFPIGIKDDKYVPSAEIL